MLRRLRVFCESLLEQATECGLAGELVIVEWNPPVGPRLHEMLALTAKSDTFPIRFIEVPAAAHDAFRNADEIPLFQMIAKNVGIRRARGRFVLATNPDLLFSRELMAWLATSQLDPGVMYRIDRLDVEADVPAAPLDQQLEWCRAHVLRRHTRRGSFDADDWRLAPSVARWVGARVRRALRGGARATPLAWIRARTSRLSAACARWARRASEIGVPRALAALGRRGAGVLVAGARGAARRLGGNAQVALHRGSAWVARQTLSTPKVHTNGCGDFTLLSRERWFALRGYPELPLWSMHLDSFLCYMAVVAGARQEILGGARQIYHLEHGRSWVTMDARERLETFARKPWIDGQLLTELWHAAYNRRSPWLVNDERWGLADAPLREIVWLGGEERTVGVEGCDPGD